MSNTALVQIAKGVILGTGTPLLRDQNASLDSVSIFDFKSSFVTSDYSTDNRVFASLIDSADDAVSAYFLTKTDYGIVNVNPSGGITLTASDFDMSNGGTKLIADTDFVFYMWATPTSDSYSGFVGLGGYGYQTGIYNQYSIAINTSNGVPVDLRFIGLGGIKHTETSASVLASLVDDQPHLFAVHCRAVSSSALKVTGYFDGVELGSGNNSFADGALVQDPTVGNAGQTPTLGFVGGFAHFLGVINKCGLIDFTKGNETRTAAEVIADEWALYKNRFHA
jgi:hypothetical protein